MKQKDEYIAIGIMSGTSCDGVDVALCRFKKKAQWGFEIIAAKTYEYATPFAAKLKQVSRMSALEIQEMDVAWGKMVGQHLLDFTASNKQPIDLVASHGHTVFHQPEKGFSYQIGNAHYIHSMTGLPIVYDFRTLDVALGGQGAPLVPIGDRLLFSEYAACVNLGGFANLSFEQGNQRIAFDVCPLNIVMNELSSRLNEPYDHSGEIASKGKLIDPLYHALNQQTYYAQVPPKSLGIEWCEQNIFHLLKKGRVEDLMHTFNQHAAYQVANSLCKIGDISAKILLTGGGAYNTTFVANLEKYLPDTFALEIPSNTIVDFKESLIFAFMGVLYARNEVNCLSSVTGAKHDHVSGSLVGKL